MDSPSTKCQEPSLTADGRAENRKNSCPLGGKLSLKADEPQVGQWHEDEESKQEYYKIIFPEIT